MQSSAIEKPEHLSGYIDLAIELDRLKEAGARFALDDLSEGAWTCLLALNAGRDKAEREKN